MRWLVLTAAMLSLVSGSTGAAGASSCTSGLLISAKTGHILTRLRLLAPTVVADGHGGWFSAGTRLTHVLRDGSVDRTWRSPVRRIVSFSNRNSYGILVRLGDRLYVAGQRRVVAVDAGTGRVLWLSPPAVGPILFGWRPTITALAVRGNRVYVGGTFAHLGRAKRGGLAALDASTGHLLSWQAPPLLQQAPTRIYAPGGAAMLALSTSRLYVVGAFNQLGVGHRRFARPGVAGFSRGDGRLTSFVPRARIVEPVFVAAWGRLVLLGCGARVSVCEADTGVFDARTGTPDHRFAFDEVRSAGAAGFAGSTVYLGTGPEGGFGGHNYLIAIDLRTGKFKPWFPKTGYYASVSSIAVSGDRVLVAGSFCPGP